MIDATDTRSFCLGLTAINEVRKCINYIIDDIYISFYWSDLRIEDLTGYGNMTRWGKFPGYGRPGIKTYRNSCRNLEYENFPGYGTFPGYGNYPGYGS